MPSTVQTTIASTDRRALRTRAALRDALAAEIEATGDLSQVTVTAVSDRANVTRRTFYSHYRDIPGLVTSIEEETIAELRPLVQVISQTKLEELDEAIHAFQPCPGSIDVLNYFVERAIYLPALLGDGGDPAFQSRLMQMVREVAASRAAEGFVAPTGSIASALLDYYLTFAISAEVGVVVRWLTTGMHESVEVMACLMTALMFVRPGDLYGKPIGLDITTMGPQALAMYKENNNG